MARKRMISLDVIDTDAFLEMPLSTQALYFHLNTRADDDGFVGNPKIICRTVGASEDDLKLLMAKNFIIVFEDGVIVIKHWRMHNTLSANRYKETNFLEDKACLKIKPNKAYTLGEGEALDDSKLIEMSKRQTETNKRRTKDEHKTNPVENSRDKKSIEENREEEERVVESWSKPTRDELLKYILDNDLNVNVDHFIDYYESNGWKVGANPMQDWKATLRRWDSTEEKQYKSLMDQDKTRTFNQLRTIEKMYLSGEVSTQ